MRVSFLHTRQFTGKLKRSMTWVLGTTVLLLGVGIVSSCAAPAASAGRTVSTTSQGVAPIVGSGKMVTRQYDAEDFSEIDAGSALKVDVARGETFSVVVTADDNIIDRVEVANVGQVLRANMKNGSYTNTNVRLAVTMPDLRSVRLAGACTATLSGFKPESLDVRLSGASELTGRIESTKVQATVSEASNLNLGGAADTLRLTMSGASRASLGDLAVRNAMASLKEASSATVNVMDRLDADLRSASNLYYVGNPTLGTITSVEASSLRRR